MVASSGHSGDGRQSLVTACPVCDSRASFAFRHPDADIYECPVCTHEFSRVETIRRFEQYDPAYYAVTHANWFENPNVRLFRKIDRMLDAGCSSVLDVGCGNGDFLCYLKERRPTIRLVGVDVSPTAPVDGIELMQGDVVELDIDAQFDAVVSLAVVEHIVELQKYVSSLARLCRPGGKIVVMTLDSHSMLYVAARLARYFGVTLGTDRLYSAHHVHHFTPRSLRTLLERAGFTIEDEYRHNAPLRAIDLPETSAVVEAGLRLGVWTSFATGKALQRTYLQTVACTAPT
jgi:SAM-dependent methyltransferase